MRLYRLTALAALVIAALPAAGAPATARADSCAHLDAVFYTTDSARLGTELSKFASACDDYYIHVTPTATGAPRPAPLPTIRSLGPHFHAMAEFHLVQWASYAATNGWYAAGVEFRREMAAAGFDVSLGDTWAVNETGEPSGQQMAVDVIKGNGTARQDLRDLVRGLYTGPDGTPSAGLVFAADPTQVTTDLAQYTQDLSAWYADAPFWQDMSSYVRFWAQETYADARTWAVPGSTLAARAAYLDDYFLHGSRLAAGGDGATDAARAFLARAYTPIGNASYRQTPNTTTGIGFGNTASLDLGGMLSFVSAQTYALRSATPAHFGFAVVPASAVATETVAVEDQIGQAILGSESDPLGACGTSGTGCDYDLAGAQFTDAWKSFANTLEGQNVAVHVGTTTVTYAQVDARGATHVTTAPTLPPAPSGFQIVPGAVSDDVETTASYSGPVGVCVPFDVTAYAGLAPHLFFLGGGAWSDVTTTVGIGSVCGRAPSVGTFAVFAGDPTPPQIVPHVSGTLGNAGWYTGDVTVSWDVADPQSPISAESACDAVTIDEDTKGTTLACTATSDGGTASVEVTVRRDATSPTVRCAALPWLLWPPNGRLVPVAVVVTVRDATSGPAGFTLTGVTSSSGSAANDVVGFDVGTPDVRGFLRAARPGPNGSRVYRLGYTATDAAGNTAVCVAKVVAPDDLRRGHRKRR